MTQNNVTLAGAADRVFRNAKVYSVALDDTVTRAEAVAVKDGKIVYVGTNDGAAPFIGDKTRITDCKGCTILPGFGDGHMHIAFAEQRYGGVLLFDLKDLTPKKPEFYIAEIQKRIKAFMEEYPETPVLLGGGWDRVWFDGSLGIYPARPITRKDLDTALSDRPMVLLSYCGHVAIFNSKALEVAGMLHTGVEQIPGGEIRMGEDGIPDGFVQETAAIFTIMGRIPGCSWTKEDKHDAMAFCFTEMAKQGLTIGTDYLPNKDAYDILAQMAKNGEFTLRLSGSFTVYEKSAESDLAYAVEHRKEYEVEDLLKADAVKFFLDGNLALIEPYPPETCKAMGWAEGFRGDVLWDEENFKKIAAAAQKAGFHLHVHAMGDRAVDIAADVFGYAREQEDKDKTKRNVIVHISFIKDETKRKMAKAGLIANVQPLWENITYAGSAAEMKYFGKERFVNMYPNGSLMDNGIVVAFGSDFTVNPFDTFGSIQIAMTRLPLPTNQILYECCKNEPTVNPAECLSLQQAVKAGTINVAYELGLENITGSIEAGKSAELVLIDRDLEATPVDKIYEIKVLETLFKGKSVYKAE